MAKSKSQVDLSTYRKPPRLLGRHMEEALRTGALHVLLDAVKKDSSLRLDILDHQFNLYYSGGRILRVLGRQSSWQMDIDTNYLIGDYARIADDLPLRCTDSNNAAAIWAEKLATLKQAMGEWWRQHPNEERQHSQAIARANIFDDACTSGDYIVLDLEYQWAKCQFDMVAARRNPTKQDSTGWAMPHLVFIEVKCKLKACRGKSGLKDHALDYLRIVTAPMTEGLGIAGIKNEFKMMIEQKRRLGLICPKFPFSDFSDISPYLLLVLVNLDPTLPGLQSSLEDVRVIASNLPDHAQVSFMGLLSPSYVLNDGGIFESLGLHR